MGKNIILAKNYLVRLLKKLVGKTLELFSET